MEEFGDKSRLVVHHPKVGKIAIKVINHYGDEVLKVYDVEALGSQALGFGLHR